MEFKRLKALYDADAGVHYEGKLCEIISINELKKNSTDFRSRRFVSRNS